jgi:hypothetical protein
MNRIPYSINKNIALTYITVEYVQVQLHGRRICDQNSKYTRVCVQRSELFVCVYVLEGRILRVSNETNDSQVYKVKKRAFGRIFMGGQID